MKTCTKCKQVLDENCFVKDKNRKDGRYPTCRECVRNSKKTPPKWRSRREGLEWCKVCGQRPRLSYHHYCHLCKMEYQNRTRAKKWAERYGTDEKRRKDVVRHYATNLLHRGKIKRDKCAICGNKAEHFHHYDYERKTMNFDPVCTDCHVKLERQKITGVDRKPSKDYFLH